MILKLSQRLLKRAMEKAAFKIQLYIHFQLLGLLEFEIYMKNLTSFIEIRWMKAHS
jgi:hypothetical protein